MKSKKCKILVILIGFSLNLSAQSLDYKVVENIVMNRNPNCDVGMNRLTNSSDYVAISTPILLSTVGLIKKDKTLTWNGIQSGIALLGTYSVGYILKKSVNRNRPYEDYPDLPHFKIENDASFPSGSTSLAFTTATSLTMAFPKWYVAVPAYTWASAVGYSRLHLGAHYPTDVLAGAAIGTTSALVSKKLTQWIRGEKRSKVR